MDENPSERSGSGPGQVPGNPPDGAGTGEELVPDQCRSASLSGKSRRARGRLLTGLAVTPMILLAACSQLGGVGVSSADEGARIMMHFARCSSDALVTSAQLRTLGDPADPADDVVLWEIRADTGAPLDAITVGAVPAGFEQTVPLGDLPIDQRLVVRAGPKLGSASFLLQELQPEVFWNGEFLASAAFREKAVKRGACNTGAATFSGLRSFFVVLVASVAGVLSLAAGGAVLIWRSRRRRVEF